MEFLSGFESTLIHGTGRDVLDQTGHTERFAEHLSLARASGLRTLRYSIPWHRVEATAGVYDWRWTDRALAVAADLGLDLIADPLHHGSYPHWLTNGFADRRFVDSYRAFVIAFAERFPYVGRYTLINEPLVTSWFCGHEGMWHPYRKSGIVFAEMLGNCVRAIAGLAGELTARLGPGLDLIHNESCERHFAADPESEAHAAAGNARRFLVHDLLMDAGVPITTLGLDYYPHCQIWWAKTGRIHPPHLLPFRDIAADYLGRYDRLDVMLSETNVRGTPEERRVHLHQMVAECRAIERVLELTGRRFRGFCWYPWIDSADWDSLVTRADGHLDPQGIYSLNEDRTVRATCLSAAYRWLARENNASLPLASPERP